MGNRVAKSDLDKRFQIVIDEEEAGKQKAVEALFHFKRAGEELLAIKRDVGHKRWLPTLEKYLRGKTSIRSAQEYMRIAKEWDERLAIPVEQGLVTSLRDGLALVRSEPSTEAARPIKNAVVNVLRALTSVAPGLSRGAGMMVQSECFIFQNGKVRTYNGGTHCEVDSPLDIEGAINGQRLLSVLNAICDQDVAFAAKDAKLVMATKDERRKATLNIEPVNCSFADFEPPKKWKRIPDVDALSEAIRIVGFCAGRDDSVTATTCLHICPKYVEATDGYSACRYFVKTGLKKPILIKEVGIHAVHKASTFDSFSLTSNWFHLRDKSSGLVFSVILEKLDGEGDNSRFPNLNTYFASGGVQLKIPKKPLRNAIRRATVFTRDNNSEMLSVNLRRKRLSITARDAFGSYRERIKVKYGGPKIKFPLGYKMLRELAKHTREYRINDKMLIADADSFVYAAAINN